MNHSQPLNANPEMGHQHRHGWMMMACCIPMLVLAVVLVTTGFVSARFLLVAVGCAAMMALMMRAMSHSSKDS